MTVVVTSAFSSALRTTFAIRRTLLHQEVRLFQHNSLQIFSPSGQTIQPSLPFRLFSSPSDQSTTTASLSEEMTLQTQQHSSESVEDKKSETSAKKDKGSGPTQASLTIFYNDVYEVQLPPRHRFPMSKYRKVRELAQQWIGQHDDDRKIDCEFRVSPLATVEELETTHCPKYIRRYIEGDMTELEQRNVGFPWNEQSVKRSLSSVGGTLAAACTVVERSMEAASKTNTDTNNQHQIHWGAHVAAGTHHAFYDYGEGFSVFSDMAVAANVVLQRYPEHIKRILFIDLDVHQGNGNAVLFQNKSQVATFSVHCKANYFSEKQESDLDIELPAGCDDETYLGTLKHWLNRLQRGEGGQFDLIFYQAGVDVLEVDRLGRMALTSNGVARRNQMVYDFANALQIPLVISMGGGYPRGDDWTPLIQAHANVYYQAFQFLEGLMQTTTDFDPLVYSKCF